jgi:uncharacterized protein (TIGR03083 family)
MNTLDILRYGNRTLLAALEGLPHAEWDTPGVCGVWSAKDILAHLASYEHLLADVLGTFLGRDAGPTWQGYAQSGAQFNDLEVDRRKGMTVPEVLAEYEAAHEQVMERAAQIPVATYRQNGTIPWYGPEYCLDDLIVYNSYGHKREHSAQIHVYRDQLTKD